MELMIKTDLASALPREIDFNFEQLKAELAQRLEKYNTLVVTEDAVKGAKADRAALNKLKIALDDGRKEVRAACLAPYETFERRMKELIGMVDAPIAAIDRQVKGYEEAKKQEKRAAIEQFYLDSAKDFSPLLPLARLWDDRWLNATFKQTDAEQQIAAALTKARNDVGIIRAMHCGWEQQLLDKYLQTLDMSAALAEKTRLEEQQKRFLEYQQQQATLLREPVQVEKSFEPPLVKTYSEDAEPVECLDFRVWVTPAQKLALKRFLTDNHIKFGRVQ